MDRYTEKVQEVLDRQITDISDLPVKAKWDSLLFLLFDDGRWMAIGAEEGWEGFYEPTVQIDATDHLLSLVNVGLLTMEDVREQNTLERKLWQEAKEKSERGQLARLKAKYEVEDEG